LNHDWLGGIPWDHPAILVTIVLQSAPKVTAAAQLTAVDAVRRPDAIQVVGRLRNLEPGL
jgi:hypothetical protein